MIAWQDGVKLARTRGLVRVNPGRRPAVVLHWPIPADERRSKHTNRTGTRARVELLATGRVLTVDPADVELP